MVLVIKLLVLASQFKIGKTNEPTLWQALPLAKTNKLRIKVN
jgi:hypothetical protein